MIMPSMSRCGSQNRSSRSLQVPGSDSSALQTRYTSVSAPGNEAPLHARREARAATTSQVALLTSSVMAPAAAEMQVAAACRRRLPSRRQCDWSFAPKQTGNDFGVAISRHGLVLFVAVGW